MNAFMAIQIRIQAAQAQKEVQSLRREVASLQQQLERAQGAQTKVGAGSNLTKWGSQVQWAGRQLTYNFTIPLAIAGAAATKFALENEAAMVRVNKVYGDSRLSAQVMTNELKALEGAFRALSDRFGVHQQQVIEIAGDWAAAGASGIALARGVKLTLEAMVLGEMEAAAATEALIAIQAQYGLSTQELSKTIDTLNMVENETGVTMEGLIQTFARAAGSARSAGVDVQHLAALTAALVPASGSAANAGNALKTILSRLLAPTKEAAEIMGMMGMNTQDMGWQSLNGAQRLEKMAEAFDQLSDAQKAQVSASVAGRWQINRFDVLMRDIINPLGYYNRALEHTASATETYNQKVKELNAVLDSSPHKLQQMWVILQNALADVIQPLIPWIVWAAKEVAELAKSFSELEPWIQKAVVIGAVFLALIGPIGRYVGATAVLFGQLAKAVHWFAGGMLPAVRVMGSFLALPFTAAATGVGALFGGLSRLVQGMLGVSAAAVTSVKGMSSFQSYMATLRIAVAAGFAKMFAVLGTVIPAGWAAMKVLWVKGIIALWSVKTFAAAGGITAGIASMFAAMGAAISTGWAKITTFMYTRAALLGPAVFGALGRVNFAFQMLLFTTIPGIIKRGWAGINLLMMRGVILMTAMFTKGVPMMMGTMASVMAGLSGAVWAGIAGVQRAFVAMWTAVTAVFAPMAARLGLLMAQAMWAMQTVMAKGYAALVALSRTAMLAIATLWGKLFPMILVAFKVGGAAVLAFFKGLWPAILAFIKTWGPRLIGLLTGPWGIAITAIVTLLSIFWNDIKDFFSQLGQGLSRNAEGIAKGFEPLGKFFQGLIDGIVRLFYKLPEGIQKSMIAVVNIIKQAALAIYEWFSYINPFAHHSPSLVETVTWGMAAIKRQFQSVGNVGAIFGKAATDLAKFKKMAASMNFDEWSDQRGKVKDMMPGNLGNFNALVGDLKVLNTLLAEQQVLVTRQQNVVDSWKKKLDAANTALDLQQNKLDAAADKLQKLQNQYQAHADAIANYSNTGIVGMQAMDDAIFANTMEQKRLQLAIMDLEDAGGAVEDISGKMASLQGDIEKLRGESNDLRAAGAGSDVLGPINSQIDAMQAAYDAMGQSMGQGNGISDLQKQLADLQRQGTRLDLENSLQFDGLERQIQQAANASKELTFAEIIAGIQREQAAMTALQPQLDAAQASYDAQSASVDQLTAAKNAVQAAYDQEYASLQTLKDEYQLTADAIREIEAALNDVASAASAAKQARDAAAGGGAGGAGSLSPGAENFMNAAGGEFPDVGGMDSIAREGGFGDQSGMIDEFTKQLEEDLAASLASINPLTGLQNMWDKVVNWWNTTIVPAWNGLVGGLKDAFSGIDFSGFTDKFAAVGDWFKGLWEGISSGASQLWDLFGPQLKEIWDNLVAAVGPAVEEIKTQLAKFGPMMGPVKEALGNIGGVLKWLWDYILKPLVGFIGGTLVAAFSTAFSMIGNIVEPVISFIGDLIGNVIQVIRGLVNFIVGVFTGDWSRAWTGITEIFGAIWSTIVSIFTTAWDIVYGLVSGLVEGIVEFFTWLWDVLVGHSIIPDMVLAIIDWFKNLWDTVIDFVSGLVNGVVDWFVDLYNRVTTWIKNMVVAVVTTVQGWYNNIVNFAKMIAYEVVGWILDMRAKVLQWIADLVTGAITKWNNFKDTLIAVAKMIWDKVVEKFQQIRNSVMEKVNLLKDAATTAFNTLRDNMLGAFTWVKDKIGGIFDNITTFIKTGINSGIKFVNKLIDGLNKVADILPGLDWNISTIPLLAKGGAIPTRRVGGGFETNGARAIVGEGKANHPEFVIPTDPTHRRRASALYEELGKRIGAGTDDTGLGMGGWEDVKAFIGKGADLAGQGVDWLKDVAQGAASVIFEPIRQLAQTQIDGMTWQFGKKYAQAGLNQVWEWVTGTDEAYRKAATEVGGSGPWRKPATGYRMSSPFGMRTHPITGQRRLHDGVDLAGPMGSSIFAAAGGRVTYHSMNGGLGQYAKVDHGAGLQTWYGHLSGYVGGPRQVTPGELIARMGSTGASTGSHLHFIVKQGGVATNPVPWMASKGVPLADGGIVGARRGGTLATIGEAGRDEAVIPLPRNWQTMFQGNNSIQSLSGRLDRIMARLEKAESGVQSQTYNDNRTFHFHGDLSFPNIKDENDAEKFIRNLEDLAGK
jgi:TP901 family phage tail tape measure protein